MAPGSQFAHPALDYAHTWECLLELQQLFCYQPEDGGGQVQVKKPGSLTGASNPDTPATTLTLCLSCEICNFLFIVSI